MEADKFFAEKKFFLKKKKEKIKMWFNAKWLMRERKKNNLTPGFGIWLLANIISDHWKKIMIFG